MSHHRLVEVITFYHIYNNEQARRYEAYLDNCKWNKSRLRRMNVQDLKKLLDRLNEDPEYETDAKEKASKYD